MAKEVVEVRDGRVVLTPDQRERVERRALELEVLQVPLELHVSKAAVELVLEARALARVLDASGGTDGRREELTRCVRAVNMAYHRLVPELRAMLDELAVLRDLARGEVPPGHEVLPGAFGIGDRGGLQ